MYFPVFSRSADQSPPAIVSIFSEPRLTARSVWECPVIQRVRAWKPPLPSVDEEYFEWIDLLESVLAAERSYTMIELGAGYGRWVIRAALALKQFNGQLPYRLIAVEAEPTVFQWLRQHFRDNEIDASKHLVIHGAVSEDS